MNTLSFLSTGRSSEKITNLNTNHKNEEFDQIYRNFTTSSLTDIVKKAIHQ